MKKLICIILSLMILLSMLIFVYGDNTVAATKTASKVLVDGEEKLFDAYNINGNNYFKLRDIANVLSGSANQFDVTWDGEKNAINLISGKPYTVIGGEMHISTGQITVSASLTTSRVYLDGSEIALTAYNIGGNNYFKLRDLGTELNFGVDYDEVSRTVLIYPKAITDDSEILRAISYGFVPKEIQRDWNKTITYGEFCRMISDIIAVCNEDVLEVWEGYASDALLSEKGMQRQDGMMAVFYAVCALGLQETIDNSYWMLRGEINDSNNESDMYDISWNYPLFPKWEENVGGEIWENFNYMWAGYCYCIGKASLVSGNRIFDFDKAKNSMRVADMFTREEAVLSAVRLYEAVRYEVFVPAAKAEPCTIPQSVITLAYEMPKASCESIPKWYGCTMDNKSADWNDDGGMGIMYRESDVRYYAEQGVTFLRVPLDVRMLFRNGYPSEVNEASLKDIDDLISWGIKYSVHICLDFHNMDGFTTDSVDSNDTMFENQEQQEKFTECWAYLAERYANIPNNVLSFNLLNEPHGDNLTDEAYSDVMLKAIEAIREYTPDRLIFADMMNGTRRPVYGLVNSGVAQSVHLYDNNIKYLSKYTGEIDSDDWKVYFINGFIHKNNGPLTIHGNFRTGTKITVSIDMFHAKGEAVLAADGVTISSLELGGEQVGDGGCIGINEEGTDGECRSYQDTDFVVTLTKDASKLEIYTEVDSMWMMVQGISIKESDSGILLWRNNNIIADESSPVLTVVGGEVIAEDSATMLSKNDSSYIELMRGIKAFSDETGIQVMVQEFGIEANSDHNLTMVMLNQMLSAFDDCGFGWCLWSRNFSFLAVTESDKRVSATYEEVGENRWADTGMLVLLKKYMSK